MECGILSGGAFAKARKAVAFAFAVALSLTSAATDAFPVKPVWRPSANFHFISDSWTLFPEREAFRALTPSISVRPVKTKEGLLHFPIESCRPPLAADGSPRPFAITMWTRPGLMPANFFVERLDPRDPELFRAFRKEHPGLIGIRTGEWVNEAKFHPKRSDTGWPAARKGRAVSAEEVSNICARAIFRDRFLSRTNFIAHLKWNFDRIVEMCYRAPDACNIGDGCYCCDHLEADWGIGGLWMETSRNYRMWQVQLMFCRGAASQFNLPFHWYVASYFKGFNSNGQWCKKDTNQTADTLDGGISRSAVKRVTYLTYLAGASSYQREAGGSCYRYGHGERKGQIAPEGEIYEGFYDFVKRTPDRGLPLRPVAIVVPRDRGYNRDGGNAFLRFPLTRSDRMLDLVESIVLDYPHNKTWSMMKSGVERVMSNSRFGDVFDVLVPDVDHKETFARALLEHRVAVIAGEIAGDEATRAAFAAFLRAGGKVVNVRKFVPEGDAAEWKDPQIRAKLETALEEAVLPLHPFKVEGDVQFGFNRTARGYLVYLIDNAGVTKFGDKPEVISPGGAEVSISLGDSRPSAVRELVTRQPLKHDGRKVTLVVPHGDIRVVEIVK